MRNPSTTDFPVDVDGIGTFMFGKRTMRDQFKIDTEIAKLTSGLPSIPDYLSVYANAFATIIVMAVSYPDGWDPEALDPVEEESYRQVLAVHAALRDKEDTFRGKLPARNTGSRQAAGADTALLVSGQVQTPADGPAVP